MAQNKLAKIDEIALIRKVKSYSLEIIPVKNTPLIQKDRYIAAYKMWKTIWSSTLLELEGLQHLPSDDFTRQDHIAAIFEGPICRAITLHRIVDLSNISHRDDSYFKVWPPEAIQALQRDSSSVLICSYLAVDPDARSRKLGFSLKDLMVSINSRFLIESPASVFAGITRNDRGMNTTCENLGATVLSSNLSLHGVEVDLVAFYKKEITAVSTPYSKACDYLWRTRTSLECIPTLSTSDHPRVA